MNKGLNCEVIGVRLIFTKNRMAENFNGQIFSPKLKDVLPGCMLSGSKNNIFDIVFFNKWMNGNNIIWNFVAIQVART